MQFVVNKGGKVHSVADEEVEVLIHERGMRLANDDEKALYFKEQGLDENGNVHDDAAQRAEEARKRQEIAAFARQENPPTEAFATPSSDNPMSKVREAKRQRALAVEATMTPTAHLQGANASAQATIDANKRVIDEADKANAEAKETFHLQDGLPSATDQAAWLTSAEPKSPEGIQPTPAHQNAGLTVGDLTGHPSEGAAADTETVVNQPADPAGNA